MRRTLALTLALARVGGWSTLNMGPQAWHSWCQYHTSLAEIFDELPRIDCIGSETDRNYGLERPLPCPYSAAGILDYYYNERKALADAGKWCYNRLHEEPFTWPFIQRQMLSIVDDLLKRPAPSKPFKGFGTPTRID
jgi:hypothetical protein